MGSRNDGLWRDDGQNAEPDDDAGMEMGMEGWGWDGYGRGRPGARDAQRERMFEA